ncbi:hypothetical protein NBM05_07425 [Rothia sp. AR01]|uniref:Uncharacterized protein n=1 Tax=Rothia santali TaxID=2949643 RepID=A0A9X2HAP6_9MICC|nr:hypothetical protein [Rothia santali]MCP3425841.1 hypothetical protein [Rothia santali]
MDTENAQLTLAPASMSFRIDGTTVPCSSWGDIIMILAQQAMIHEHTLTTAVTDADGTFLGCYDIARDRTWQEAGHTSTPDVTVFLTDWYLTKTGTPRPLAHFKDAQTARKRLNHVAEATGIELTLRVEGQTPNGPALETYRPAEPEADEAAVPNGTADDEADADPEEIIAAELAAEEAEEAQAHEADVDEEQEHEESDAPEGAAEEQADDAHEHGLHALLGFNEPTPEPEPDEDTDDGAQRPKRLKRVLMFAGAPAAALLLVGGIGTVTFLGSNGPEASAVGEWGQQISQATDPSVSLDAQTIAAATSEGYSFIDVDDGTTIDTIETTVSDDPIYPYGTNGFYISGDTPQLCTRDADEISCSETDAAPEDQRMLSRAGTIAYLPADASQPVDVLTADGLSTFSQPRDGAAYIGQAGEDALWASNRGGGDIITATENGSVTDQAIIEAPSGAAELTSWAGPTDDGGVAVLWEDGDDSILATHDPSDGSIRAEATIPTPRDDTTRATRTGSAFLLGDTVVTADGKTSDVSDAGEGLEPGQDGFTAGERFTANGHTITLDEGQAGVRVLSDEHALIVDADHLTTIEINE